jgi:hypothetical protein
MQETGYGSDFFTRACGVSAACREVEGGGPRARWRRLRAGAPLLAWYRFCLPSVTVRLTAAPAGRMIGEHLAIREEGHWRYRRAQAVLSLPAEFSGYLRGRHRQAVRTNVARAREADLTIVSSTIEDWVPGDDDTRAGHIGPGPVEWWRALDPDGEIVAQALLSVDEDVALLQGLISSVTYARWLLHTAIVERLCGHCTVLLVNSDDAYLLGTGQQHFQRLLGYTIARLRLSPAPLPAPWLEDSAPAPIEADRQGELAVS